MSDLISKRELYHKLGEAYNKGYLSWGANEIIKDIIGECNSVENKGEWIPVSERLPEDGQLILASYPDFVGGCMITKYNKVSNQSFLAWMPLPEPYKAESEDKI